MAADTTDTPQLDEALAQYSREKFTAAIGQTFLLRLTPETALPLTLRTVSDSRYNNPQFDSFVIYFSPQQEAAPLPDDSYLLEHHDLGKLFIHLSATLASDGGPRDYEYEAVFNLKK